MPLSRDVGCLSSALRGQFDFGFVFPRYDAWFLSASNLRSRFLLSTSVRHRNLHTGAFCHLELDRLQGLLSLSEDHGSPASLSCYSEMILVRSSLTIATWISSGWSWRCTALLIPCTTHTKLHTYSHGISFPLCGWILH